MSDKFIRTETNVYFLKPISLPTSKVEPEVTHHIFVVDRSGSMTGDIEALKDSIAQVLTVESLTNASVETTLISFSSSGDVTLHWAHVPADNVADLDQPYMKILKSIRATYLTGISQALHLALDKVKPNQTTGVTLFTDGYANDPSPMAENKALDSFVVRASTLPNVFVNCIGYRDWCDWPRMGSIANALSGKCIKATSFKAVLSAMKDTQTLLGGRVVPARVIEPGAGTRVLAVNRTTGQVNFSGDGEGLVLRGTGDEESVDVYRVTKTDTLKRPSKSSRVLGVEEAYLAGALCSGLTLVGAIREAKEVLFASGNKTLWEDHQSAMTPSSLAEMNKDLATWIMAGNNSQYEMGRNSRPQYNLFDLAKTLNELPPRSIGIDTDSFQANYRRRSIVKIYGTRLDDGTIQAPAAITIPRENARTYIRGVSFNRSDASVQLETEQAVWVKRLSDGKVLQEVEFVSLDRLREYRSFTLISSGERNMDILPIEVYTKEAWKALSYYMLPHEARVFSPGDKAKISLKRFRMEAETIPVVEILSSAIHELREAEATVKILSPMVDKAETSPFTDTQVAALKSLHLTPALYFSPPTTTHYKNKDEAVRLGEVDSFVRYRINFSTPTIRGSDDFRSGNAFLDRRYVVKLKGQVVSKPKLDTYLQGAEYEVKPPNPKAKDTVADGVMAKIADEILLSKTRLTNEELTARLRKAKEVVEACYDLFQPLVMEIGCTGLIPAELEHWVRRYEPEAFATMYGVKLGKDEQEGIFYVLPGDVVISVVPEVSWYTVKLEESEKKLDIAV